MQATGGHSRTFGALDPVQVTLMAPHLTSIYVSGWQSSSTVSTSNEPGALTLTLTRTRTRTRTRTLTLPLRLDGEHLQ